MAIEYVCEKEKGGKYYCRRVCEKTPIKGSHGDKKSVIKMAAELSKLSVKEYMRLRKNNGITESEGTKNGT